jgi:hypothetical protein
MILNAEANYIAALDLRSHQFYYVNLGDCELWENGVSE